MLTFYGKLTLILDRYQQLLCYEEIKKSLLVIVLLIINAYSFATLTKWIYGIGFNSWLHPITLLQHL